MTWIKCKKLLLLERIIQLALDRFNWNVEELIDYKVTIKKQINYEASKWYQKVDASKKFKI